MFEQNSAKLSGLVMLLRGHRAPSRLVCILVHSACAQQLEVGTLLRQAYCSRAGQQPLGYALRFREAHHPRADENGHPVLLGVGGDAGDGRGANQGQPGGEDAKPGAGRLSGATQSAKSRRPWERSVHRAAHGSAITQNAADLGSLKAVQRRIRLLPVHSISGACLAGGITNTALRRNEPQRKVLKTSH